MKNIVDKQKFLAQKILEKLKHVDPTAIVAGGAPRDWYFEKQAEDIDVFVYFRPDLPVWYFTNIIKDLFDYPLKEDWGDTLPVWYKKNNYLRCVYSFNIEGQKIQIMLMSKSTFYLLNDFPINLSKAVYKNGKLHLDPEFIRGVKDKTLRLQNPLYGDGDAYIQKLKSKFSDYRYEEDFIVNTPNRGLTI